VGDACSLTSIVKAFPIGNAIDPFSVFCTRNAILLISALWGSSRMATTQFYSVEVVRVVGAKVQQGVTVAGFRVQRYSTDELQQVRSET
jgi:hypothetical protein